MTPATCTQLDSPRAVGPTISPNPLAKKNGCPVSKKVPRPMLFCASPFPNSAMRPKLAYESRYTQASSVRSPPTPEIVGNV